MVKKFNMLMKITQMEERAVYTAPALRLRPLNTESCFMASVTIPELEEQDEEEW